MVKFANEKAYLQKIVEAQKSGDEAQIKEAWKALHDSIAEQVKADFTELQESNDAAILAQRGYRQLTAKETKWYQKVISAMKSADPKQAFTAIIGSNNEDDLMPTTIIEDIYKNLKEEYPLLKKINFQYVGYVTKWILNDHSAQNAVWGQINDAITKEITSSFKVVDIKQNKLSAYAVIEMGMLDLGPVFLDGYIRTVLAEAISAGLERAIIKGSGVKEPIGLIKDIHEGVEFNSSTGYPDKEKVILKSFSPANYGAVLALLSETENGKKRKFKMVTLICNMTDYLTKVMPATTALTAAGTYATNLFPFPTDVCISNEVDDGEAVLFVDDEYFMGMGGDKNGVIEYSDEYKFLEDQRVFKMKQYGSGRAFDNTSALYLDISDLEPAYIMVKHLSDVTTA
ncbi:MAG: phage major capsid protein [Oscillospiraceae bacterium]|nr:phage major capsid protein [Oscillospiraceae bacterium]